MDRTPAILPIAMTVEGPIPVCDLGFILPHEHVLIDTSSFFVPVQNKGERFREDEPIRLANLSWVRYNTRHSRDCLSKLDLDAALHEVDLFRKSGGGTILDLTAQIKNRTSPEVRLSDRNGHATFCADVFYMKIKKIVKPLQARSYVIRPTCFLFEKSLELPCLSQIAGTCDGTNCQHGTVKNQHGDQEVRVPHA